MTGARFPTYSQEYALVTSITEEIMATKKYISGRTKIYSKAAVSDIYTLYFCQAMKQNDATYIFKAAYE